VPVMVIVVGVVVPVGTKPGVNVMGPGAGLLMFRGTDGELPPPGAGFATVTLSVPASA